MSFTYDFNTPNDTLRFAYCPPYPYSRLLTLLPTLNHQPLPSLTSLSGLPVPLLEITDNDVPDYNKRVVLITARVHPGESNSSLVAEGMLEYVCGKEVGAKELRKLYIFYVVPMLNPDGVIAGNYRTSFFGKDLNRTFDQSRKHAFPQTYHLLQFARQLKRTHKQRFCLYLDLHGHSVKKNVFMYGPQFPIHHPNYETSRQLPRLLASTTSAFRYYSCSFRISNHKTATARAILNRGVDIPYTYTMESSNGFYYDSLAKSELPFTPSKWKDVGVALCKALLQLRLDQHSRRDVYSRCSITQKEILVKEEPNSDDEISEGKSDSEPEDQDLSEKELREMEARIEGKDVGKGQSPEKGVPRLGREVSKGKARKERATIFLPPINSLNRAMIFSNRHKKKESFKQERLRNIESQLEEMIIEKTIKPRFTLSQIVLDAKPNHTIKPSSFHFRAESSDPKRIQK